jgi:porphobilinogen synthase
MTQMENGASTRLGLVQRPRRNRKSDWSRRLVRESSLDVSDLLWPIFLIEGVGRREAVASMPGVYRQSIDLATAAIAEAAALGVPAVALFPNTDPTLRDERASMALDPDNLVCRACRAIKATTPDIGVITDVALDPYTSHGHDGLLVDDEIVNDETVAVLTRQAVTQARAGSDIIAPSDMMDGRVGAIRAALDAEGFQNVQIMSYAAKYASAFYNPFRDAIGSSGALKGDKKTYQMDYANSDEALREVGFDIEEGADMVMVKPALAYLDVIRAVKERTTVPVAAYNVSGEYSMIEFAARAGVIDRQRVILETLTSIKRAGADLILTYHAVEAAGWVK